MWRADTRVGCRTQSVEDLLAHLRASLGRPQVSDLTDHLSRYFKGSRRRSGESINDYISRKTEIYLRACQAYQRVKPHQKKKGSTMTLGGQWTPTWSASRRNSRESDFSAATTANGEASGETEAAEEEQQDQDAWSGWRDDQWSYGSGSWSYNSSWGSSWSWSYQPWGHQSAREPPTIPELLPDYVQGWYLLHESGLSGSEKNVVQTAQSVFGAGQPAEGLRKPQHQLPRGVPRP